MELTDAQLKSYGKAKRYMLSRTSHMLIILGLAIIAGIVTFALPANSHWHHGFLMTFATFVGMAIIRFSADSIIKRFFAPIMEIAEMELNSDASNISRLTKIREKA